MELLRDSLFGLYDCLHHPIRIIMQFVHTYTTPSDGSGMSIQRQRCIVIEQL